MIDYSVLSPEQAEQVIFDAVKRYDEAMASYGAIGIMCRDVEKRLLWKYRPNPETGKLCESMGQWMKVAAPSGRSTCYAAKDDVAALPDIPDVELAQVAPCNFGTLRQLSTAVRSLPEVLETAKGKRTKPLVEYIQANHSDQHVEHGTFMRLAPSETQKAIIDQATAQAMEEGATSITDAIAMICVEFNSDRLLEAALRDGSVYVATEGVQ